MRIKLSRVIVQMKTIITSEQRERKFLWLTRLVKSRYTFQSKDSHTRKWHVLCCCCSIASHRKRSKTGDKFPIENKIKTSIRKRSVTIWFLLPLRRKLSRSNEVTDRKSRCSSSLDTASKINFRSFWTYQIRIWEKGGVIGRFVFLMFRWFVNYFIWKQLRIHPYRFACMKR